MTHNAIKKTNDLSLKIKHGLSWNFINICINKSTSLIVRLGLAKILLPEDFGLVSMVLAFLGLFSVIVELGLQNTLVQIERDCSFNIKLYTAFWVSLILGILFTLLFILVMSEVIANFYSEQKLLQIAQLMAISLLFSALKVIPTAILTRLMKFKKLAIVEITSILLSCTIAISLAYSGKGYWSLAALNILQPCIACMILWKSIRWRPRIMFSYEALLATLPYSISLLGAKLIYYIRVNLHTPIIGFMLGSLPLGLFVLAFSYSEGIRQPISSMIDRVMFPVYSRFKNNKTGLRQSYLQTTQLMSMIIFPFAIVIILYAGIFINNILDSKWLGAEVILSILTINSIIFAASGPSTEVLQATGKAKLLFNIALINLIFIAIPSMILFTYFLKVKGAALAFTISFFLQRLVTSYYAQKQTSISFIKLIQTLFPSIALGIMSIVINKAALQLQSPFTFMLAIAITFSSYGYFAIRTYKSQQSYKIRHYEK